jgi:L-malate glycosyltransferase
LCGREYFDRGEFVMRHAVGTMSEHKSAKPVVFVWDNFGPMHVDRCEAMARRFANSRQVIGIELSGKSSTYDWQETAPREFLKLTLFAGRAITDVSVLKRVIALLRACLSIKGGEYFFCHYEEVTIFVTAIILRLRGRRVFIMNDSKYDDKPRYMIKETIKWFFLLPYNGALVASKRSGQYFEFLHFPKSQIAYGYDTISVQRIREQAACSDATRAPDFTSRHFTVVARMVPKKNLFNVLEAFASYRSLTRTPRELHFCGSGPLEQEVRRRVDQLGLANAVVFHGFVQSEQISRILADSLALILVSTEEQFGLAVAEALALSIPVIVSPNCGARDELVRSGVNGFLVEPDNARGLAHFMDSVASDENTWRMLSAGASEMAELADVSRFVSGCDELLAIV